MVRRAVVMYADAAGACGRTAVVSVDREAVEQPGAAGAHEIVLAAAPRGVLGVPGVDALAPAGPVVVAHLRATVAARGPVPAGRVLARHALPSGCDPQPEVNAPARDPAPRGVVPPRTATGSIRPATRISAAAKPDSARRRRRGPRGRTEPGRCPIMRLDAPGMARRRPRGVARRRSRVIARTGVVEMCGHSMHDARRLRGTWPWR